MRVETVDGLVTLFYDGSKELWNRELDVEWFRVGVQRQGGRNTEDWESWDLSDECKRYWKERQSWQQIIVLEGVTEIPNNTFRSCKNIKRVIFADTVIRIGWHAFTHCKNLVFIKLSLILEYIGDCAFSYCNLSSIFIPPRCREIGGDSFKGNTNLTIFNVFQDTILGYEVIGGTTLIRGTAFIRASPIEVREEEVKAWIKSINNDEKFALHRVCASFQPTLQMIVDTMKEKGGPTTFKVENSIGITPSQYLKENPYAEVTEKEIIENFILQMMGGTLESH